MEGEASRACVSYREEETYLWKQEMEGKEVKGGGSKGVSLYGRRHRSSLILTVIRPISSGRRVKYGSGVFEFR